jgi:sec-independent protein translocase protein TatC
VDDAKLPLTDHLAELRSRLIKTVLAWTGGAVAAWSFREEIFSFLLSPAIAALAPDGGVLQAIAPTEIFFTYFKCALLAGFVLALPVVFWQIWAFVSPGLYSSEKKAAVPFVVVSTLLFAGGASFGHLFVFPIIYQFFASMSSDLVQSAWTMREVFSMTTHLFLAFGVAFELPVVIFFLAASGIVEPRQLIGSLRYGIVLCFIAGAVLTPPDVVSQVLLSVPLVILYLLGVGAGWLAAPRRRKGSESTAVETT